MNGLPAHESAEFDQTEAAIRDGLSPLTEPSARALTKRIKQNIALAWVGLLEADVRLAWQALGYTTFAAYVMAEFQVSQSRAYQMIDHAKVIHALTDTGMDSTIVESLNEAQARQIADLPAEAAAEVVEKARESGGLTAASLREAREEIAPKPAKVTQTTRTTEATKIERDIDEATGEVIDDSPAAVIAKAKEELKTDPLLLAQKAIERLADARKTVEAAGGVDAIEKALNEDTLIDPQLWRTTLDHSLEVFSDLNGRIRRRNLRSV